MNLVDEAKHLFENEMRPTHFTNHKHCQECAEHDNTLRNATPDTLTFDDVAPGWDPLCFISVEGFKYYFPAMVRLVVEGEGETYYVDQFLFHLTPDGPRNARIESFSTQQRAFVIRVLEYLLKIRASEIEENLDADHLFQVLEIWGRQIDN